MHFGDFGFGSVRIGKATYEHDLIIDRGKIRKGKKKPSKKFREEFGHTPVSIGEEIPWSDGRSKTRGRTPQVRPRPAKPSSSSRRILRQTRSST